MIELVISGGQSGADQAGWRAAKRFGILTRGWMPKGFRTEDGPRPEFAELYGATEHESPEYPPRTRANVTEADLTIWIGREGSAGYWATKNAANKELKPFWSVRTDGNSVRLAQLIRIKGYRVLNVAGNRESKTEGIGVQAEQFMAELFHALGHTEVKP